MARKGDGEEQLGADLAVPGAAEPLWAEALARLEGRIDVLVNNAGIYEPISIGESQETVGGDVAADAAGEPAGDGGSLPAGGVAFSVARGRGPDRQCGEPGRLSRRFAGALALRRGESGDDRGDEIDRARFCGGEDLRLSRSRPGSR